MSCTVKIEKGCQNDRIAFSNLVKIHNVSVTKKWDDDKFYFFSLDKSEEYVEEILIYSQFPWDFN